MNIRKDKLQIAEEAAEWLYRLQDNDTAELRQSFSDWLQRSPLHMREFLMMTAVSRELDGVDSAHRIDVGALARQTSAEPVPFGNATPKPSSTPQSWRLQRHVGALAAGILVVLGAAIALWQLTSAPTYSTAIGEQRSVKLEDGSMIYLNTRSRVEVRYSGNAREIHLQEGEALFAVESDPARPFRVIAGDATVRALGTKFNVLRREDQTKVSVVEGSVQITRNGEATTKSALPIQLQLVAGEEARVGAGAAIRKQTAPDIGDSVAWQQRRLVFRDTSLSEIAGEFNRYNRRPQFEVVGPETGARLYTGTFDADDPQSLQELLSKEKDLRLEIRGDEIAIRTR